MGIHGTWVVTPIIRKSKNQDPFLYYFWSNVICRSHHFLFGLAEGMVRYWEEEKTPFKHKQEEKNALAIFLRRGYRAITNTFF